jgi:hypothetical protein
MAVEGDRAEIRDRSIGVWGVQSIPARDRPTFPVREHDALPGRARVHRQDPQYLLKI